MVAGTRLPLGALMALSTLSMMDGLDEDPRIRHHREGKRRHDQPDYDMHVYAYRIHLRKQALKEQERLREEARLAKEKPVIDAAAAKRLRKQQKRLKARTDSHRQEAKD